MSITCEPTIIDPAVAGDIGDTRTGTIGGVLTLVGATAAVVARLVASPKTAVTIPITIDDTALRTFTWPLGTVITDWLPAEPAAGEWFVQVRVTFGDGSVLTFPPLPDSITISSALD